MTHSRDDVFNYKIFKEISKSGAIKFNNSNPKDVHNLPNQEIENLKMEMLKLFQTSKETE